MQDRGPTLSGRATFASSSRTSAAVAVLFICLLITRCTGKQSSRQAGTCGYGQTGWRDRKHII
jgi:hypothetical protein